MKTYQERYEDAVNRNLHSAATHKNRGYRDLGLNAAKRRIGIRADDCSYDERVIQIIEIAEGCLPEEAAK